MKIKRITAFFLSCLLLLSILSGCGENGEESGNLITYLPTFHKLDEQFDREWKERNGGKEE